MMAGRKAVSEEPAIPIWLHAVRLQGRPGWQLEESLSLPEDHLAALNQRGAIVEQAIVLARSSYSPRADELPDLNGVTLISPLMAGWCRDLDADCWRAPHEAVAEPARPAPRVEGLAVAFDLPTDGELGFVFSGAGRNAQLMASTYLDPFDCLVDWLDSVLIGDIRRFSFFNCREHVHLHLFGGPGRCVRLAIGFDHWSADRALLDVSIDRAALAASIYGPLRRFWSSEAFAAAWNEWDLEPPHTDRPAVLRSQRLDALIGVG